MKLLAPLSAVLCLCGGVCSLLGQAPPIITTQFDFWNWQAVKTPGPADGIRIDPEDDSTWYVASSSGLFLTRDNGATWTQCLTGAVNKEAIAIDPLNPSRVYAGAGTAVYVSTDRGQTWNKAHDFGHGIASLLVSTVDGSIFLGPRLSGTLSGVYRSTDQGSTWQPLPFGAAFPGVATTWDLVEEPGGALWAGTEALSITPGKMMLFRSTDRGATWFDLSGPLSSPPTQLLWDSAAQGLFAASRSNGVIATGNAGGRWVTYINSAAALSAVLIPVPNSPSAGLLAGLDSTSGGGATFSYTLAHSDLISPTTSPDPITTGIGPAGVAMEALAANHDRSRLFAATGAGGIYAGTVFQPHLNPATVFVPPGDALVVKCDTCPMGSSMILVVGGQQYNLTSAGLGPYSAGLMLPAVLTPGIYPAELSSTVGTVFFTLVVGPSTPIIKSLTTVRFEVKAEYAPGEVVCLFGAGLTGVVGAPTAVNYSTTLPLPTQLAQSQVRVDGSPAPLYFGFTGADVNSQINFQIPPATFPGPHTLTVNRLLPSGTLDAASATFSFNVRAVSPTYAGNPAVGIYAQNITQGPAGNVFITADTPAHAGDVVTIYATGLGATNPPIDPGTVPPAGTLAGVAAPVTVLLTSGTAQWNPQVFGAVASPQFPGLYQISFRFPTGMAPATPTVNLVLTVGTDTQTFSLNFAP